MMECCSDFLGFLDSDTSLYIFTCLDDPADLVRVSCVSRSWRHYVIANGLCKKLCLRMFPQLSRVARVVELNQPEGKEHAEVGPSYSTEWLSLEREHRTYAFFARAAKSDVAINCISGTIAASSTDNFPQESIINTLEPEDQLDGRYYYWSSTGQSDPTVPETLTYKLHSDICLVTEINVQPFQAYFQIGEPIYSAKSVRFKMGHPNAPVDASVDEEFVWTYTSPEFPMDQEYRLQNFRLPEPVLCIGGILQIELLGRVQKQEMDDLFYICVSYVQVAGYPLPSALSVEILEPSGMFALKCDQLAKHQALTENGSKVGLGGVMVRGLLQYLPAENFMMQVELGGGLELGEGMQVGWVEEYRDDEELEDFIVDDAY